MHEEECTRAPQTTDMIKAMTSQGRAAEPEEVAESIAFLCSPASSYINGVGLVIDSGLSLTVLLG
jgi:NAD(P)-dependent dehydrogenase (short-subunit alcohol dehydrogenase family)